MESKLFRNTMVLSSTLKECLVPNVCSFSMDALKKIER